MGIFLIMPRTSQSLIQSYTYGVMGFLLSKIAWSVYLTAYFHLVTKLGVQGVVPPIGYAFMA
jgi:hypothetical protein